MRRRLKSIVRGVVDRVTAALGRTRLGSAVFARITTDAMRRTHEVEHHGVRLRVTTPNALNVYRADTFATKEPETLEWIDAMPAGSVLWDVGANVGLYACYAAKHRRCRVFAFEPSVFNLELLARNVFLNGLTDLVTIVPLPLNDARGTSTLNMSSTEWGGALSTFGKAYGHDGAPLEKVFEFRTLGVSMTDARDVLGIPQPDYIKMDVDGIEHLILQGGGPVVRGARGVLVEINDRFTEHATEATRHLEGAGLTLSAKRHAECFEAADTAARYTFNQIWTR